MDLGKINNETTNFDFEEISYEINLAGVTWENRQDIVKNIVQGTDISLERDYHNQYDKNAIAAKLIDGTQVGWIPKKNAAILAPELDAGIPWKARVESILGTDEKQFKGVLIKLFISQ